jgi:Leucine-rich repeat (LRR) protein
MFLITFYSILVITTLNSIEINAVFNGTLNEQVLIDWRFPLTDEYIFVFYRNIQRIEQDCFLNYNSLISVDVSNNEIYHLHSNTFNRLVNLTKLDISSNQLEVLSVDLFKNLNKLQFLNFGGNKIKTLELDLFTGLSSMPMLTFFGARGNQIVSLSKLKFVFFFFSFLQLIQ